MDANEKAATQAASTRLIFPLAIAYLRISKLLGVGQEAGLKRKYLKHQGKVGIYVKNGDSLLVDVR